MRWFLSPGGTTGCTYGVVEGCYFDVATKCEVDGGAHNIALRNNALDADGGVNGIMEIGPRVSETLTITNVDVLNNTFFSTSSPFAPFLRLDAAVDPIAASNDVESNPQIDLQDNLFVAPGLASSQGQDVWVQAADTSSFATVSNNLWQRGYYDGNGNSNEFVVNNGTGLTLAQWNSETGANDREHGTGSANAQVGMDGSALTTAGGASFATHFVPNAANISEVNWGVSLAALGLRDDLYAAARPSTNVSVGAVQVPPPSPSNLSAAASGSDVALSWSAGAMGNALATDLQGYNVYRSSSGSGPWSRLNSTPITSTSYTDSNPGAGTWYYYVTAIDLGSNESSPSGTASATIGTGSVNDLLWPDTTAPTDTSSFNSPLELGVAFTTDVAGQVSAVQFYKPSNDTGQHDGNLWNAATGQNLGRVTFTNETASGWQQANFSQPIQIVPGNTYIASYSDTSTNYAATLNYFSNGPHDSAPLHAPQSTTAQYNGVFAENTDTFPTLSYYGTNYWVQPVFSPNSASFVKTDSTTQGTWTGVYGADGYSVVNGSASIPSYVSMSVNGSQSPYEWTWVDGTQQALQTAPNSSTRVAACDYSTSSMTVNVNITGGNAHQVALYLLDGDNQGRTETVQAFDAASGAALGPSTSVSNFAGGQYIVYSLSGNVKFVITNGSGSLNCVLSGVFFG